MLWTNIAIAQDVVTGVIKNNEGLPVVAATVVIKGTNSFVVTDTSGQFSITARKELPFTLRISLVGYKP